MTNQEREKILNRIDKALARRAASLIEKEPPHLIAHDLVQEMLLIRLMIKDNNFELVIFE